MIENLIASLPMLVCAFWSVITLLDWYERRTSDKMQLLHFSMAATLLYMGHYVFFCHADSLIPVTDTIYCFTNLAVYPLYYLYISEVTDAVRHRFRKLLILLPAVLTGLTAGILYSLMDSTQTQEFISVYLYRSVHTPLNGLPYILSVVHDIGKVVFALQIPPILIMGLRRIKHFNSGIDALFADTENKKMYMIRTILMLFIVISFFSFMANVIGRQYFFSSVWLMCIPSVLFSVLLFALEYAGHRQNFNVFDLRRERSDTRNLDISKAAKADEAMPVLPDEADKIDVLCEKIKAVMESEQMFRKSDLKLSDIAMRMNTNRDYVYQAINGRLGVSFAEYINRHRVDYAAELLTQHPDMPLVDVALHAGYTSTASFYRNFRRYKECTPADWRRNNVRSQPPS